jgi:hypothetical protein
MDLSDYEFLPGTCINVDDPEKRGRIKAVVPTWFDTSVMQEDAMPWIVPVSMPGYQRFSKLEMGSKVFVLHRKNTDKEYWYWPLFELTENTKQLIEDYDSPEVLLSRSTGDNDVFIYYNASDGIKIKNGDLEVILNNEKEIHITDQETSFDIVGGNVTIGKQDDLQSNLMGEDVKQLLLDLGGDLVNIGNKMSANPYTSHVGPDVIKCGNKVQQACNNILSETIKTSR